MVFNYTRSTPTGRIRLRASRWFGRPVAQLEFEVTTHRPMSDVVCGRHTVWRDAVREDVLTQPYGESKSGEGEQ